MAEAFLKNSQLKIVFDLGFDEMDKPVHKSRTFNSIRRNATAAELYETAQAIASLSVYPIWAIERNDSFDISE